MNCNVNRSSGKYNSEKNQDSVRLKQKAAKGSFWGLSSNIAVSAISFIGTAILARLLEPKDFGLLGMAVLITGVVRLFGKLGLGAALVQKKNIDEEYLSTAFWASLIVSTGLFVVAIISAPFASIFFGQPVVKWIIICLSVNFIITAVSSIHRTLLYKEIKLKDIAVIEVVSRILRVIVILTCAFLGMGVWSIVIGMVVEGILKTIFFMVTSQWKPSYMFNMLKFKELFRFGKNIYGQGFLGYFTNNLDFILTGRLLGAQLLGFYQFAFNIPHLVKTFVLDGIAPVAFPVFSKVNDDKPKLARGYFVATKYICILTFPILFGLAFCANDFISIVYGTKWLTAVRPLQILCLSGALFSANSMLWSVFNSVGRSDMGLKWGLFSVPVTIVLVIYLSRWGIVGVASAMVIMRVLGIALVYFAMRILGVKLKEYFKSLKTGFIGSMIMLIFLYLVNFKLVSIDIVYYRFASNIIIGGLIYVLSLFIFFRDDFISSMEFVRMIVRRK